MSRRKPRDILSDSALLKPLTLRSNKYESIITSHEYIAAAELAEIKEEDLTLEYVVAHPEMFESPFLSKCGETETITGTRLPTSITIKEISTIAGESLAVELIDVETQSEVPGYTLGEYAEYLEHRTPQHRILNLISLEISSTPLSAKVQSPEIVRQIDWIDTVWPLRRRSRGDYPQVQKYCLISMQGRVVHNLHKLTIKYCTYSITILRRLYRFPY
jgi:F-box/leucine-rich repeat protein 10/11